MTYPKFMLVTQNFSSRFKAWMNSRSEYFDSKEAALERLEDVKPYCKEDWRIIITENTEGMEFPREGKVVEVYQPANDPSVTDYAAGHARHPDQIDWALLPRDWVYQRLVVQGLIQRLEDEVEPHCAWCGGTDLGEYANGVAYCSSAYCASRTATDEDGQPVDCRREG